MREPWLDDLLADGPAPTESFRTALRRRVLDAWDTGDDGEVHAPEPRSRRRVFAVLAAAAVVAIGVTGIAAFRSRAPQDEPAGATSVSSAAPKAFTARDVVGTWVVTETNGVPRPSPLPTYHFKLGTGPNGRGVVIGFDGCNLVEADWAIENERLVLGDTSGGSTAGCPPLASGLPLAVPIDGARMGTSGRSIALVLDSRGTTSVARRIDDLARPTDIAGSTWILAVDGPDLQLTFADELTAGDDAGICSRTGYHYEAGQLVINPTSSVEAGCRTSLLWSLLDGRFTVARFSDGYSDSILLVPPTSAGTVRLFPGGVESAEASADTATD